MNILKNFHFQTWHFGMLLVILLVLTNIVDAMTVNNIPRIQNSNFVELSDNTFTDAVSSDICYVLFFKEDCVLCEKMEYNLNQLSVSENKNIKCYKLDINKYPGKYSDYLISGTPSVLIYKNGKEAERIMGVVSVSNLQIIHNRAIK